jgi:hypothetical protein
VSREQRARQRRAQAAARYQPDHIRLLLIAAAPPSALDRHFYFEAVPTHDSLFRHVARAVLGETPSRDKAPYLDALRDRGVFLIHVSDDPFEDSVVLPALVPRLLERVDALQPDSIVVVGAPLYDLIYPHLRAAGHPVEDVRLPYPGSGQQRRFLDDFAEIAARL